MCSLSHVLTFACAHFRMCSLSHVLTFAWTAKLLEPEGFPAISRSVERSDTTGTSHPTNTHPKGMPECAGAV